PQRHDADDAVLEPLCVVAHGGLARRVLLKVLGNHEMPEVPFLVEVLHFHIDDVRRLERLAGAKGALDGAPGLEIANLDPVERLALAGLDELVVDHGVRLVLEQKLHARANLAGGVTGHFFLAAGTAECAAHKRAAYDNGIVPHPPARTKCPASALADGNGRGHYHA